MKKNWLYLFRDLLVSFVETVFEHHRLSLTIFSFILIALLIPFKPLPVYITIDKLINKNFKTSLEYFKLKEEFHLGTNALVIFEKKNSPFSENELCLIRKWTISSQFNFPVLQNSISPLFLRKALYEKGQNGFDSLLFKEIAPLDCDSPISKNPFISFDSTPWAGLLVGKNQRDFMHEFNFEERGSEDLELNSVAAVTENLMSSAPHNSTYWLGEASYQYFMAKGLAINNALNGLIVLIILFTFRCFFGTWKSGFIFIGTLIYSSLILFSLMSLFHVPIDILNNCLFLLLTVSSLGDFSFLSHHLTYNQSNEHWLVSFKKIVTPSFFTSLTTFVGFISLCTSDIDVIRRLGIWAGISGLIEWIVVMFLLPPLLKLILKENNWVDPTRTIKLLPLSTLETLRPKKKISLLMSALIFLLPFTFHQIYISDVPAELFKKDNLFRRGVEYLHQGRGFRGDVSLVFNDKGRSSLNQEIIEKLRQYPNVARIDNPYETKNFILQNLKEEQKALVEDGLHSTLQFQRMFSQNRSRAIVYLKEVEMKDINQMRNFISRELCPNNECILSGALIAYAEFSQMVPQTLFDSFILSLALVFVCLLGLAYFTQNLRHFPALLVSSFWGVAVTLLLMAIVQVRVNFVTCVVISILVGMTGDNTIQYILGALESENDYLRNGILQRSGGSLITTFIMILCSTVFFFYYFEPPKVFGGLLIFGFFSSLAGDLWLLQGLLEKDH